MKLKTIRSNLIKKANEYVDAFDSGQIDFWLLEKANDCIEAEALLGR